jgi:uncharacterized protein YjbI with pentapeptide repeats
MVHFGLTGYITLTRTSDDDLDRQDGRNDLLAGANLKGLNLKRARHNFAELTDTNLAGANLEETSMHASFLKNTNLERASFNTTLFSGAKLTGVRFNKTEIKSSFFNNLDLSVSDLTVAEVDKESYDGIMSPSNTKCKTIFPWD